MDALNYLHQQVVFRRLFQLVQSLEALAEVQLFHDQFEQRLRALLDENGHDLGSDEW